MTSPTKLLLSELIRQHIAGKTVIGLDTSPTGTGKTTSGSEFFRDLNDFLINTDENHTLKIVIVASQHRYLGQYWKNGYYKDAIRFLGSQEYARKLLEITQGKEMTVPVAVADEIVKEGLTPWNCPLQEDSEWLEEFAALAPRPTVALPEFRSVCRKHLLPRLQTTAPDVLFHPCNRSCPIAGGDFFSGQEAASPHQPAMQEIQKPGAPRIALITAAKLRYRAASFTESNGEIVEQAIDFKEIERAIFVFEEANEVFETSMSYVDENSAAIEYLSCASLISEFFRRRRKQNKTLKRFYDRSRTIYLTSRSNAICKKGTWLPVNIYMAPSKTKRGQARPGHLMSVCRDRASIAIGDIPKFDLTINGGNGGIPQSYRLEINDTAPSQLTVVIRSIFRKAIIPFVRHFVRAEAMAGAPVNTRRVTQEVYETLQMHSATARELIALATSSIDSERSGRNIRSPGNNTFADDHYYLHGVAFAEIRHRENTKNDDHPSSLSLFVSHAPPEQTLFRLLQARNSILLSSASVKLRSPLTNLNLDWLLSKHRGILGSLPDGADRVVLDLDQRGSPLNEKKDAIVNELFDVRRWEQNTPDIRIFPVRDGDEREYEDGLNALLAKIEELNAIDVPVVCIVATNSYRNARKILRRLTDLCEDARIGELIGINTDRVKQGLSVMERWVSNDAPARAANGLVVASEHSMLFDSIEDGVARCMGRLLGCEQVRNGIVVGVYKKMMRGANFRVDTQNVVLSRIGKNYLRHQHEAGESHRYLDFNGVVFAEHPRSFVTSDNYRRVAIQAISIGDRTLQQELTAKLRAGSVIPIQHAVKWSDFGAMAVVDLTNQGVGRFVRCRVPLPAHRFLILSDKHARLFMLGNGGSRPDEIMTTPDLRVLSVACKQYWIDRTISCDGEDGGVAEWISRSYKGGVPLTPIELEAIRDVRDFLSDPSNHAIPASTFLSVISAAIRTRIPGSGPAARVRAACEQALHSSYIRTSKEERTLACAKTNTYIIRHAGSGRISLLSYPRYPSNMKSIKGELMLLKPRELFEIAYPAGDERAIEMALRAIRGRDYLEYEVKAAIDHETFMGAVLDGSHEAGDFLVTMDGVNLLLDCKTTAIASKYSPWNRSREDLADEVTKKTRRLAASTGKNADAFVFMCSAWPYHDMWYTDSFLQEDCNVPVYWMDACTLLNAARMPLELKTTLTFIVNAIKSGRNGKPGDADTAREPV
ncbi:hypothetical protein [Massilia sp. CCM 8734]|uniref:hypothetical protein n=1 Tax=Massilia sp. CCM 8734 TaxID=2609283 RepID=UPI00141F145D|nr:hypothetical protein [Massilia sp. CCM 8734]NHZ97542.1 hypothetical protein [Massilia sp. CCM 8734]